MFGFGKEVADYEELLNNVDSHIIKFPVADVPPLPNCRCIVCTGEVK